MSPLIVRLLEDPDDILAARRLQGRRYLDAGFVDRLRSDGTIDDPYVAASDWFGAEDVETGTLLGVSRLIGSSPLGFPAIREFELDAEWRHRIEAIAEERLVEVSALAIARAPGIGRSGLVASELGRAMYHYSLMKTGVDCWVAAIDVRVRRHLTRSHGFRFEDMGPSKHYLGSETVPVFLDLQAQMRRYLAEDPRRAAYYAEGLVLDLAALERQAEEVDRSEVAEGRRR